MPLLNTDYFYTLTMNGTLKYCDLQLSLETGSFTAQFDRWNAQVTKGKFKCCQAEMQMLSWEF
jgi:hypothetical protein